MTNLSFSNRETWVDDGRKVRAGLVGTDYPNLDMPFRYFNLAKMKNIVLGTGQVATLVEWDVEAIPAASVSYMIDELPKQIAPFIFRFFKHAWYSEQIDDVATARRRIEEIQGLANVLPIHQYMSTEREANEVPQQLIEKLGRPELLNDVSVISKVDDIGEFPILSIGENSLLRKSNYTEFVEDKVSIREESQKMDELMTSVYEQTVSSGVLFFDECIRYVPNFHLSEPIWLRYTRVLAPIKTAGQWTIMSLCLQNLTNPVSNRIFGNPGAEVDIELL